VRFLALLPLLVLAARATTFYIAPTPPGSDANPGTLAQPWASIQKAADTLAPGDTALVRGGVYPERVTVNVSGSAGSFVTFQNYPGEEPIIDATGFNPPAHTDTALLLLIDRSYVIVRGFTLRNYKAVNGANNQKRVPCGVMIRGASHHVEIRDCVIHDIWNHFADGNAFGLAVYGDDPTPMSRIIIDGCEIHSCRLGNSESLAINGNVTDFEVTNNLVHDNTNIGIVAIGYEKTCCGGASDPEKDRARDGAIRGNVVWNCTSTANPAYRNTPGAGGIYIDGGTRILIERNISYQNDIGLEIASEHRGKASDFVTARNNLVWRNKVGGLFLGGYDKKRGRSENNVIRHNTFWQNDTRADGNGEVLFQHRVRNNVITHNLFVAGPQNYLLINPRPTNSGNVLDYNLWFAPAGAENAEWQWKRRFSTGFSAWQEASGGDSHSLFADPQFINIGSVPPDLHLGPTSPAIDAGDPVFTPAMGELEIDALSRLTGPRVDLGADEISDE
jgi:hypothetical protein